MPENTENKESKGERGGGGVWGFWKKVLMWAAVAAIVVVGLLALVGNYLDEIGQWVRDRQAARYEEALQKYVAEERARYAADKDGGKTPEETLDLLIAALNTGDIEQASKYWELSMQEEEALFLKDMLQEKGNLQQSIEFYVELKKNGEKKCNKSMDGCVLEYYYVSTEDRTLDVKGRSEKILIPAGERSLRSENFVLNKYTNVWKISR